MERDIRQFNCSSCELDFSLIIEKEEHWLISEEMYCPICSAEIDEYDTLDSLGELLDV